MVTRLLIYVNLIIWSSLSFAGNSVSSSSLEHKWGGTWERVDSLKETMPEEQAFKSVNVYNILEISNVNENGFNYRHVGNDVGYGPNEVTYQQGLAVYTKEGHAKDKINNILLRFIQGEKKWDRGITLVNKDKSNSYFKQKRTVFDAGFDCDKAGTHIERKICATPVLARADKEMGKLYSALRKKLPKTERNKLRKDQRSWMKQRNKQCQDNVKADLVCLSGFYASRLLILRKNTDPVLGEKEILDSAYMEAIYSRNSKFWKDTVFRLTLANLQKDSLVQEWEMYQPVIKAIFSDKEVVITGSYQYETIIWPNDVVVSKAFQIVVDHNAQMWLSVSTDIGKGFVVNTLGPRNLPVSVNSWVKENQGDSPGCDQPIIPIRCR